MQAVVLAAGEGKRMYPLTQTRPKVMVPVANKPLLEHVMLAARDAGISEFVFVVGYKKETVKEHFGNGSRWGVSIKYIEQEEQFGTAHAIGLAKKFVSSRFLVLNGDVFVRAGCLEKAVGTKNGILMVLKKVENPSELGVAVTDGGCVRKIIEKPPKLVSNLASSGIFIFTPEVFDAIERTPLSARGEYEITDTLQILIDGGTRVGYVISEEWMDIGRPWDLLEANENILRNLKNKVDCEVEPNAALHGPVATGNGTIIRSGSYIIGPVVIGDGCDIGPNCFIRPYTAIGNKVRIGNAVEIKNSIIMDGTHVGHLSYVGDSIVGYDCNFGAGAIVANLRLDEKDIQVTARGKLYGTGRKKLGTIMGDGVHTGINSTLNTGSVIPAGKMVKPFVFVKGEFTEKKSRRKT